MSTPTPNIDAKLQQENRINELETQAQIIIESNIPLTHRAIADSLGITETAKTEALIIYIITFARHRNIKIVVPQESAKLQTESEQMENVAHLIIDNNISLDLQSMKNHFSIEPKDYPLIISVVKLLKQQPEQPKQPARRAEDRVTVEVNQNQEERDAALARTLQDADMAASAQRPKPKPVKDNAAAASAAATSGLPSNLLDEKYASETDKIKERDAILARTLQADEDAKRAERFQQARRTGGENLTQTLKSVMRERNAQRQQVAQTGGDAALAAQLQSEARKPATAAQKENDAALAAQLLRDQLNQQEKKDAQLAAQLQSATRTPAASAQAARDAELAAQLNREQLTRQAENDAKVAAQMAAQMQSAARRPASAAQTANDAALAAQLHKEQLALQIPSDAQLAANVQAAINAPTVTQEERKLMAQYKTVLGALPAETQATERSRREKSQAELKSIMDSPAVQNAADRERNRSVTELTDAHAHTRTIIRNNLPRVIAIDNAYNISHPNVNAARVPTVAELQKEICDFVSTMPADLVPKNFPKPTIANIKETFRHLDNHIKKYGTALEREETNTDVLQLVFRTWTLATRLGARARASIAITLDLNIRDEGKCMPGLVARLYSPYIICIEHLLKLQLSALPVRNPSDPNKGKDSKKDRARP